MAKATQKQPQVNVREENAKWYDEHMARYESLAKSVAQTIRDLLEANSIDFVDIKYRGKTKESFLEKIERKGYSDFEKEMTDLAGVRVIVLLESDITNVSDLVSRAFSVHPDDSGDKSKDLGLDRVGYRSVHFVCDIGSSRDSLPEFSRFKDKCFEVQVRTVLQNTWADIAHSRSYKLKGKLPNDLSRRLNLISGMLELVDLELSAISRGVDDYKHDIDSMPKDELINKPLDSVTLAAYFSENYPELGFDYSGFEKPNSLFEKLDKFGFKSVSDLSKIIDSEKVGLFIQERENFPKSPLMFMYLMLIVFDMKKFFEIWPSAQSHKFIPSAAKGFMEKVFKSKGKDLEEEMKDNQIVWGGG